MLRQAFFATAALLTGCASSHPLVLTEAVGPAEAGPAPGAVLGTLVVYSAWDGLNTIDPGHPRHTSYRVCSPDGTRLMQVRNERGPFGTDPQTVQLAPGRYTVEARATNLGPVQAPVVVRAGETTVLYLDGATTPTRLERSSDQWVRRPDGQVVGRRASAN